MDRLIFEAPWLQAGALLLMSGFVAVSAPVGTVWALASFALAATGFCLAGGVRRPIAIVIAVVAVLIVGSLIPSVVQIALLAAASILAVLLVVLRVTTPFRPVAVRGGLAYSYGDQKHVFPQLEFEGHRPFLLKERLAVELIEMTRFADQLLARNGFNHMLVGGTLIGAIRHKAMVPWDDDVDFALTGSDDRALFNEKFEAMAQDVHKAGYRLARHDTYYKIQANNFWRYPAVDLYVWPLHADETEMGDWEGLHLPIPADADAQLKKTYGHNWLSTVVFDLPFWDSGFVPAFVTRLTSIGIKVRLGKMNAVIFDLKSK